jgi:hypothetical protein
MHWLKIVLTIAVLYLTAENGFSQHADSVLVEVIADQLFCSTSVQVTKGETYLFTAKGEWQDADFPATDANGFKGFTVPMFFGMLLKPMPSQYYMKLCGKVKNWKFPIGTDATITVKRSGELQLFANDAKGFCENNKGTMKVTIQHIEK